MQEGRKWEQLFSNESWPLPVDDRASRLMCEFSRLHGEHGICAIESD